jgi:replication factor A2
LSVPVFFLPPPHPPTRAIATSGSGIHIDDITSRVSSQGYSVMEIKNVINNLSNEGHIYSTIDENHYQYAE